MFHVYNAISRAAEAVVNGLYRVTNVVSEYEARAFEKAQEIALYAHYKRVEAYSNLINDAYAATDAAHVELAELHENYADFVAESAEKRDALLAKLDD